jgi:hypothetical protein
VGFHAVGVRGRLFTCRIALAFALAGLATAPAAHGYTFGAPAVRALGPEVTVFDYSTSDRCATDDIPDQPARAFRNAAGEVVLIDTHHAVRRFVGNSLATVTRRCPTIMTSGVKRDPALYDDREWLASTYTHDGSTIYGLIHAEYQGWQDGNCGTTFEQRKRCWYNAITLARSDNGGASFTHAPPPTHYVAGPPYQYSAGIGPIGFFQPSNIVRASDGFYYVLVHVEGGSGVQPTGSCLWRTSDLADPGSWRAWDGSGFTVRFRDPYVESYAPAAGVCALVARNQIGTRSESLTWSTYLKKWVLVGSADNADGVSGPGFYYHTSDDLINWTPAKLLMRGPLPWAYQCGGPEVLRDPSLLDDDSGSRNFETIGQRPYLFFTRFHLNGCAWSLDRDLIRIPIEFSKDPAPPPPPPDPGPGPDPGPQPGPAPSPAQGGGGGEASSPQATPVLVNAAAPLGRFRIVGNPRSRRDGSLQVRVRVPSAGRLEIRAAGARRAIRPASRNASKAGKVTIRLRLSAAGRKLLKKQRSAKVKAKLVFRPVGAAPQRAQRVLLLRRGA